MTDIERVKMREQVVTLAVRVGALDEEIRKAVFRRFKDKRYRARAAARNVARINAVAAELRAGFA